MPDDKKKLETLEAELTPRSLPAKIMRASKIIGKVDKEGYNAHFKFKYQAWEDVVPAVRDACIQAGICLIPNFSLISSENGHTLVSMTLEIRDTESNEFINMDFIGEAKGTDDKGVQKAITSATKYAYLKLFQIPTTDDQKDDNDGSGHVEASKPAAPKMDAKAAYNAAIALLEPTKAWLEAMKKNSPDGATFAKQLIEAVEAGCKTTAQCEAYWLDGEVPA